MIEINDFRHENGTIHVQLFEPMPYGGVLIDVLRFPSGDLEIDRIIMTRTAIDQLAEASAFARIFDGLAHEVPA